MHNDSFNADLQEVMRRLASAQPGNRQRPVTEPSDSQNPQPASRVEPKTHPRAATDT
jgi:hypothetical protein